MTTPARPPKGNHALDNKPNSGVIAILLTCVAYAYFNIGDAMIKILAPRYHFSEIVTLHCLIIIVLICGAGYLREGKKAFVIRNKKLVFIRAALSVVIALINIYALPNVHLTTFYTLVFTSPLWVALLSSFFLGEKLEPKRLAVILGGFAVILFIFRPGSGLFNIYAAAVLLSAFLYSCSMVVMRKMGPDEGRTMIITSGSILSILVALPFLPFHFVMPTLYDAGLFLLMGVLSAISITCIAYAFQNAPSAAMVAPYHYTQIVWGALLGYFLFDEVPSVDTMIGAAIIIMAGMYLIYGESGRAGKKRAESISAAELTPPK